MDSWIEVGALTVLYLGINELARRRGLLTPITGALCVAGYLLGYVFTILFILLAGRMLPEIPAESGHTILRVSGVVGILVASTIVYLVRRRFMTMARVMDSSADTQKRRIRLLHVVLAVAAGAVGYCAIIASGEKFANSPPWLFFGFAIFGTSANLFDLAWRYELPSASDVLEKDKRKPVLFLRSFLLDQHEKFISSGRVPISFETELATRIFTEVGPFIAFADPQDHVPVAGAARQQEGDDWKAKFEKAVENAACILVIEGETKGLHEELKYLFELKALTKVFVLTLPDDRLFSSLHNKWWPSFKKAMTDAGWPMPASDLPAGTVVAYRNGLPEIVRKKVRRMGSYAKAVVEEMRKKGMGEPPAIEARRSAVNWWTPLPVAMVVGLIAVVVTGISFHLAADFREAVEALLVIAAVGCLGIALLANWRTFINRRKKYDILFLGLLLLWFAQRIEDRFSLTQGRAQMFNDSTVMNLVAEMFIGWLVLIVMAVCAVLLLAGPHHVVYGAPQSRFRVWFVRALGYVSLPAITGFFIVAVWWLRIVIRNLSTDEWWQTSSPFPWPSGGLIIFLAVLLTRLVARETSDTFDTWTGRYYPIGPLRGALWAMGKR